MSRDATANALSLQTTHKHLTGSASNGGLQFIHTSAGMPDVTSFRPPQLFIVDDDDSLRDMLTSYLERHGMAVTAARFAEDLLQHMETSPPDLVILDVTLPGMSGLEACRRLRRAGSRVPIMLLTGLSDEFDRIVGLELGADDYQCKPFSAREVLARIHALLRRSSLTASVPDDSGSVRIGDFYFVTATRSLHRGGDMRILSALEYAMLSELCAHPRTPLSREHLRAACHASKSPPLLRAIDAGVMRLRRLLEPDPTEPRFIRTVRGQGYVFVPQA